MKHVNKFFENMNNDDEYDSIEDFVDGVMKDGLEYIIMNSNVGGETDWKFEDPELMDLLNHFIQVTMRIYKKIGM